MSLGAMTLQSTKVSPGREGVQRWPLQSRTPELAPHGTHLALDLIPRTCVKELPLPGCIRFIGQLTFTKRPSPLASCRKTHVHTQASCSHLVRRCPRTQTTSCLAFPLLASQYLVSALDTQLKLCPQTGAGMGHTLMTFLVPILRYCSFL